jgi:hypothetical protein
VPEQWKNEGTAKAAQNTTDSMTVLKERRIAVYWAYPVITVTVPRLM